MNDERANKAKGTLLYLLEYQDGGLFSSPSLEIVSELSNRLLYSLEHDSWSKDWSIYQPCPGGGDQNKMKVGTVESVRDDWFSSPYYKIRAESTFAILQKTSPFFGTLEYRLQLPENGKEFKIRETTHFCGPKEFEISTLSPGSGQTIYLGDVTECCGRTTFAVTFDDNEGPDFRILFLVACAMVQYVVIKERKQQQSSNAAAAAAAAAT